MAISAPARPGSAPLGRRLARAAGLSVAGMLAATVGTYVAMSTPACDSGTAEDLIMQAFNGSGLARLRGLSSVQTQDATGLSYSFDAAQRTCSTTLLLSNGARLPVRFTLTGSRWDGVSAVVDWR